MHLCERVAVHYAESLAIDGDVHAPIQIFPVVMVPTVILRYPLAFDELALRNTRVLHNGLHDGHAVVLQVVINAHLADTEMLFCRYGNIFLEIGIKLQHLQRGKDPGRREGTDLSEGIC